MSDLAKTLRIKACVKHSACFGGEKANQTPQTPEMVWEYQ